MRYARGNEVQPGFAVRVLHCQFQERACTRFYFSSKDSVYTLSCGFLRNFIVSKRYDVMRF
jgi:hypothetical protein